MDGNSQTFVGGWEEAQRGSDEGSIGFELCLRADVSFVSVQRGAARGCFLENLHDHFARC